MFTPAQPAVIRPAEETEWDTVWRGCPYATYYQSREWAGLWKEHGNRSFRPDPILVEFTDGKRAVLPFSRQSYLRGLFQRVISSPPQIRPGGWISADELGRGHADWLARYVTGRYRNIKWNLNPFDELSNEVDLPKTSTQPYEILSLDAPFDELYRRFHNKHRGSIRKAQNEGVVIREASSSADVEEYYKIYTRYASQWGGETVERKTLALLRAMFNSPSPHVKLWVAEHQQRIIGGRMGVFGPRIASGWGLYGTREHSSLRASTLLNHAFIKYSSENGYRWVDLGMSQRIQGIIDFKERFGARPVMAYKWEQYAAPLVMLQRARARVKRRLGI